MPGPRRRTPIKDQQAESLLFQRRAVLSYVAMLVVFGILLARFGELMILRHSEYAARSERNRVKLQPLPPARGLILDRHGEIVADNRLAYRLELVPERAGDLKATLDELAQVIQFDDDERKRFLDLVGARRRFQSLPLRLRLSDDEVARFALERYRFPGVDVVPYLTRHYPDGELFAHVVGYVGRIDPADLGTLDAERYAGTTHIGKTGIERYYESQLHGDVGYEKVETNAEGRVLRVLERSPPRAGDNVYLAIDARLQRATAAAMAGQLGAAVAIDPANGEVLAFVSVPSYDANLFVNGISQTNYQALLNAPGRPLFNRALQGGYEPGSTLKPFMALAGLESGVRDAGYTIFSTGTFQIPGQELSFRDWKRGGHGRVDLVESLAQSVNSYYYQLALDMGIDRMHEYLSRFGFGAVTGIDLVGESAGILPSREWKRARLNQPWYPGETVIAGIGQGYNVATLLQLANATAAIAADGRRYRPRLVHALRPSFDAPPRELPATLLSASMVSNPAHLKLVQRGLEAVLHSPTGTARAVALGASYRMAGKTGTAQRVSRNRDTDVQRTLRAGQKNQALFIGYAPVESPRIAIAVVVEQGGSGSQAAAPVARAIFDAWLGGGEAGTRDSGLGTRPGGEDGVISPEGAADPAGAGNPADTDAEGTPPESTREPEISTPSEGAPGPAAPGAEPPELTLSRQSRVPSPESRVPAFWHAESQAPASPHIGHP
jgi:penicillin-binding protein 2